MNYYNDNDPKSCAWLCELIAAGQIPDGVVDERSILDVQPVELAGFVQCHFFAGIGGWSLALKLAGWPEDKPVWTGSAPCQPYSAAGKGKGDADARNLWPAFFRLIKACQPECVVGEQVAAAIGHGWLDGICDDLEGEGYTAGAAVLGAHSVGGPHIRQRLYWCGLANAQQHHHRCQTQSSNHWPPKADGPTDRVGGCSGASGGLANPDGGESSDGELQRGGGLVQQPQDEATGGMDNADPGRRRESEGAIQTGRNEPISSGECASIGVGDAHEPGSQGRVIGGDGAGERTTGPSGLEFWDDYQLIPCADGKARRIKSGLQPLAHGIPGRVGLLRGAGNAIVPQVAAQFIKAVMG